MASTPYTLSIEVTHTTATNQPVFIRNETTRERVMQRMNASGEVVYDIQNMPSGYTNGDRIVCYIVGEEYGVSDAHTVDTKEGGATITITGADESATTSPAISIG